jgi:RimJ/RimL family protein N-acetyltransferase
MPIATSYGEIRAWRDSDLASLVKYADNRKIWINLTDAFPHPYTTESGRAFLAMVSRQDPTTYFALATPEEAIGGIGVSLNKDVRRLSAEMGYWLAEPYWGKGLMTETVTKFTDAMMAEFGLVRIHAEPYAHNRASCRLLEKAGFVLEGRMRSSVIKDGQILDQFLYAKIREPLPG